MLRLFYFPRKWLSIYGPSDQSVDVNPTVISAANDLVDNTKDIEMFRCLMDLVPSFDAILDELLVDAPQIVPLSKYVCVSFICWSHLSKVVQLTEQGQQKRQADSNEIKTDIFEYLDKPPAPEIRAGLKAVTRGFNHPLFAALLVPRKKLDIFNQDPEYEKRLSTDRLIQLILF